MPTLPWFKFEIARWMMDLNLSKCHPATRGVWIDLIVAMHQNGRSGELRETVEDLARIARTTTAILIPALTELQTTGTADVTFRNSSVTVVNRLMKREAKSRQGTAFRVQKHRSNKKVTPKVTGENKEGKNKEGESNTHPDLSKSNLFRKPVIPTIEQVKEVFQRHGGNDAMAQKFFDTNAATDWFYRGSPITNFSNLVPGFISNWNKNDGPKTSSQPTEKQMVV